MLNVRRTLKRFRVSQPFNFVASSLMRVALKILRVESESVIKHLHRVGTVRCRLPNDRTLTLWSRGDDWVSNQIYWRGWSGYEPETVPLFFRLAATAAVTLDVGAYVGFYTLLAAHANPAGRVYAFEPHSGIYERLLRNVAINGLKNVRCVASAVGETDGTADFFHVATAMPTSSSLSYEFMKTADGLHRTPVPVLTLDRFVADNELDRVDLLKIDTESTEPDVLRAMVATLRRDHPAIVCEVLRGRGAEGPLGEILRPLGYRYYLLTPSGPVPKDEIRGDPAWFNYLFTLASPREVAGLWASATS